MDTKPVTVKPTSGKLGFAAAAKITAPTMSGCGKNWDNDCGIRAKNG